jgi:hypothetical protein
MTGSQAEEYQQRAISDPERLVGHNRVDRWATASHGLAELTGLMLRVTQAERGHNFQPRATAPEANLVRRILEKGDVNYG